MLPESQDRRILKAAEIIIKNKIAKIVLVGNRKKIMKQAKKWKINISKARFVSTDRKKRKYANMLYELRKAKGLDYEKAEKLVNDPIYYSVLMLKSDDADGVVAGARTVSSKVIRAALQIIKPRKGINTISGAFLIILPEGAPKRKFPEGSVFLFADCAVNINPNYKQLAEIAELSSETIRMFGIKPKIALLSYMTTMPSSNVCKTKMCKAEVFLKRKKSKINAEVMQVDAAVNLDVAKIKNPKTRVKGDANVLVFPDLQSGNIGYKLIERFAGAKTIGPILQGLQKPFNDLSRGCSIESIVNLTIITAYQACCKSKPKIK